MAIKQMLMLALTLITTQMLVASAETRDVSQLSPNSARYTLIKPESVIADLASRERLRSIERINVMNHTQLIMINATAVRQIRAGQPSARLLDRNAKPFAQTTTVRF